MGAVKLMHYTTRRVRPATIPQYMYHERDMNEPRQTIQKAIETRQEADELTETTARTPQRWWQRQMLAQGP